MRLDKETLAKHRFWIALGAATFLWLLSFIAIFAQHGTIDKKWAGVNKADQELNQLNAGIVTEKDILDAQTRRKSAELDNESVVSEKWRDQYKVVLNDDLALLEAAQFVQRTLAAHRPAAAEEAPRPADGTGMDMPPESLPPSEAKAFVDSEKFVLPATARQLNAVIKEIKEQDKVDLIFDPLRRLPDDKLEAYKAVQGKEDEKKFLIDLQDERALQKQWNENAIYVLLCREPSIAMPPKFGDKVSLKHFPQDRRNTLAQRLATQLNKPRYHVRDTLINWPRDLEKDALQTLMSKDFGERISINSSEYHRHYRKQIDELIAIVNPGEKPIVEFLPASGPAGAPGAPGAPVPGSDAATLRGRAEALFKILVLDPANTVTPEEAWSIQEHIALIREMLKIVAETNDGLAVLRGEWREWKDVVLPAPKKDKPAGDASQPPAAAPMGMGMGEAVKKTENKGPTPLDMKRFRNDTWAINPKSARQDWGRSWEDAALLDLQLMPQGDDVFLQGLAMNPSTTRAIPPLNFRVLLSDGDDDKPQFDWVDVHNVKPTVVKSAAELQAAAAKQEGKFDPIKITRLKNPRKIVAVMPIPADKVLDHQRRVNAWWLMDLELVSGGDQANPGFRWTLYNRSGRLLQPATFHITVRSDKGVEMTTVLEMSGHNVEFGVNRTGQQPKPVWREKLRNAEAGPGAPNGPPWWHVVEVRQVIDPRTAPVKAITRLEIGTKEALADIMTGRTRVAYDFKRKDPKEAWSAESALPAAGSQPADPGMGVPAPGGGRPAADPGGTPGSSAPGDWKQRYLGDAKNGQKMSDKLREVPVAIVLIVDQAYINDVKAVFHNSRLNIVTTHSMYGSYSAWSPNTRPGPDPGMAPGPDPSGMPAAPAAEEESNLFELQLFGVAKIYEDQSAWERIQRERIEHEKKKALEMSMTPATP